MNTIDLMRTWPGLSTATPAELLASPAWRLETDFDGAAATLRVVAEPEDELFLSILLDDVPHVLGLSRTAIHPDLDALWSRRASLPEPLVIALVEKECGSVLQFLENSLRQELKLKGVANEKGVASRTAFALTGKAGSFGFSLDLPDDTVAAFGTLDNLDPAHPAIASLSREARGVYRVFTDVTADELVPDGYLLLDEATGRPLPHWETELPADGQVRLVLAAPRRFTFADFAKDALPALPKDEPLALAVGDTLRFAALPSKVGTAPALHLSDFKL